MLNIYIYVLIALPIVILATLIIFRNEKINNTYAKVTITALAIILLAGAVGAAPIKEWNRTYGGARYEFISNLQQTVDMGYIGAGDFCIFKTNGDGSILWNRTHNGLTRWVFQTQDGGYIAAGNIVDSDSHFRVWLLRTDAGGTELWNRTFRAPGTTSSDFGNFFQRTPDGGYLLDVSSVLFKIDANGNELWNRTIKPAYYPYYVLQTRDGGYIFGTTRFSAEGSDVWLTKFESDMNLSSIPWAAPVYSPGELRNGTEIPEKYRNDISEMDIKAVLVAAAREIKTFDGNRYESIRANLSLAGGSLKDNTQVKQFLFELEGYRDGRMESWQMDIERPEKGTNTSVIRVLGGGTLVPDNYVSIAESIAFRKLENESLNRTPELADASWIINRPGIVVLIFKDPESPANADVKVDLRNRSVESVEKKYWFQPSFPIYFNITSNPDGADVYLAKGGLGDLCGGQPYKLWGDHIGKTPLTYKYEYNQTFMPFSGLFSLFSFNLTGYEDTFKCINIYGGESASKLSVSIHQEGSLEPVSEAPLTYNISEGLKPKKKINIDVPGFEFVFPIGAFLLIYLLGSRKVS